MEGFKLFARIAKVDAAHRLVHGTAASEAEDKTGERFDYESSAPEFKKWSAEIEKGSGGKSRGNVRVMHQPIVAGVLTDLSCNDATKTIDITAKILDDDVWKMVEAGAYTGFSIGGRYAKRWADPNDPRVHRYTAIPTEISIVDNPCNPDAFFQMIKAEGDEERRRFNPGVKPEAALRQARGEPSAPHTRDGVRQRWIAEDGSEHVMKAAALARNIALAAEKAQKAMDAALKVGLQPAGSTRGGDASIGPQHAPSGYASDSPAVLNPRVTCGEGDKPYGNVEYADDGMRSDGKRRYPIDTEEHIRAAWCVAADTILVTNPAGPCEIATISEGANVLAFHGQLEELEKIGRNGQCYVYRRLLGGIDKGRVVAKVASGIKPLFEVRTRTKRLKATADHRLLVLSDGDVKWKKVGELTTDDRCLTVRSLPLHVEPQTHDLRLMRLFGYFVGDGCLGYHKTAKGETPDSLWFVSANEAEANRYGEIIRDLWPDVAVKYAHPRPNDVVLRVHSVKLAEQFVQFGRGAHNKTVPEFVFKASREAITEFLEGYIEADGYEDKNGVVIGSCNKKLLEQCKILALMIGWRPANILSGKQISFGKETTAHRLFIVRNAERFKGAGGGKNRRGERLLLGNDELMFEKVRSVVPLPAAPTFDVEIEGAHNFIANGFVTHNSYINKPKNQKPYSADQLDKIKARIIAAWKDKIDKDGPPAAEDEKKAAAAAMHKHLCDVGGIAYMILELRRLKQRLETEAAIENDDSPQPQKVQALIEELCHVLEVLVAEEAQEVIDGDEAPDFYLQPMCLVLPAGALKKRLMERLARLGVRHSRENRAHLDLAHHAVKMGRAMPGMSKADDAHCEEAMKCMKAAGADDIHRAIVTEPFVTPPDGGSSAAETDPSTSSGRRGGHVALLSTAHHLLGKVMANGRHSAETMKCLNEACEHLKAAGAEDAHQGAIMGNPAKASGAAPGLYGDGPAEPSPGVAKLEADFAALTQTVGALAERVEKGAEALQKLAAERDELKTRLAKVEAEPLPPKAVKLPPGITAVDKAAAGPSTSSGLAPGDLAAELQKLSPEEIQLLLIKAARRNPMRPVFAGPPQNSK
jgi:intein/homing endonuclease